MTTPRFSFPMYFPAAPFSLTDALMCSNLVDIAYDMYYQWQAQGKPAPNSFNWNASAIPMHHSSPIWGRSSWFFFSENEPFAFVSWTDDGEVYLVFRGTETSLDWVDDADVFQVAYPSTIAAGYGYVHHGFMTIYSSMRSAVLNALGMAGSGSVLYFTGHSLGGALSTLAVPDVLTNSNFQNSGAKMFHYSLASPRVGDPDFAYQYNSQAVTTYRIVNTEDIVPDSPLSVALDSLYKHVGTPVDFTAQYDSIGGNHDHLNSYNYALNNPDQPEGPIVSSLQGAGVAAAAEAGRREGVEEENARLKRLLAERDLEVDRMREVLAPVGRGGRRRRPI
ncbi:MAG TPA: lipase family protein [Pyrinomonadaceae bacterium]